MKKEIHGLERLRWMEETMCYDLNFKEKNSKEHTFWTFCEVNVPDYEQNDM